MGLFILISFFISLSVPILREWNVFSSISSEYLLSNDAVNLVFINPLSANFTKWSNTLKQFVSNLTTNCLSVFDHFVGLTLKGLTIS